MRLQELVVSMQIINIELNLFMKIYLYKIIRIFLNCVLFKLNITTEIQYIEKLENNYGPNEKLINILNEYKHEELNNE